MLVGPRPGDVELGGILPTQFFWETRAYTGLFIIIGTTFGGCTEPQSDVTKVLFNEYMTIIIKTSYDY